MNKRFTFWTAVFCVFSTLLVYCLVMQVKLVPGGDETISYLCATGNQDYYQQLSSRQLPYGMESDAAAWKAFLSVRPGAAGRIAGDLVVTDLHPPLYFWILHGFTLLPVFLFHSGLWLNLLLHIVSLFLLKAVAGKLELSPMAVFFTMLAWSLSPAVLAVGFSARQYELLGCFNLLSVLLFLHYRGSGDKRYGLFLLCSLTAGMLTQYLFLYFSLAYPGWALLIARDRRLTLRLSVLILLAVLLTYAVHPGMLRQFALQQERSQEFGAAGDLVSRTGKVILSFVQVFLPVMSLKSLFLSLSPRLVALVCAVAGGMAGVLVFRKRKMLQHLLRVQLHPFISWMLVCSLGLIILPYLFFLTPFHAMGRHYFVLVYPFLLMAMGVAVAKHARLFAAVTGLFGAGLLIELAGLYRQQQSYRPLLSGLEKSDRVVVNTVNRRAFPRLIPYLDRQKVLMDEQALPGTATGRVTLFICEETTFPAGMEKDVFKKYDLEDGVVLYTLFSGKP